MFELICLIVTGLSVGIAVRLYHQTFQTRLVLKATQEAFSAKLASAIQVMLEKPHFQDSKLPASRVDYEDGWLAVCLVSRFTVLFRWNGSEFVEVARKLPDIPRN